ncbi:hypothetical protein Rsub_08584 [Raphidocelis subcapitata]|uniref:RING-type E3 ubiquitin transferase n=1 Tax=Raphidocelis subcapitata TaxID=307507 RepID=A0A2V0P9H2_9CHLO|nr:hypothetical protein Rsub_08584 [Raphidocelis subcapitata]|eukprot:GBF95602.1 hypothetical protein Rsub_08584 [Raphidocelis subcapitata]
MVPAGPSYLALEGAGTATPRMHRGEQRADPSASAAASCSSWEPCWMWCASCFGLGGDYGSDARAVRPRERGPQYHAPAVASPQRASSASSLGDGDSGERGTLLPKRGTPESGTAGGGCSAQSGGAETMLRELPRHQRTGSGASSRAAWLPDPDSGSTASAGGAVTAAPAATAAAAAAAATAAAAAAATAAALSGVPVHAQARGAGSGSKAGPPGSIGPGTKLAKGASLGLSELEGAMGTAVLLSADEEEDCCPTCLEAYREDNPRVWTRCGHHFHMQCIYEWLNRSSTCPLCESNIDFEEGA